MTVPPPWIAIAREDLHVHGSMLSPEAAPSRRSPRGAHVLGQGDANSHGFIGGLVYG